MELKWRRQIANSPGLELMTPWEITNQVSSLPTWLFDHGKQSIKTTSKVLSVNVTFGRVVIHFTILNKLFGGKIKYINKTGRRK